MANVTAADVRQRETDGSGQRRKWSLWECWRRLTCSRSGLRFAEFADDYRRQGQFFQAAAICARGLMRHPDYANGHLVMGEIFYDRNLPDRACREWLEALRLDPYHPRAHFRLGALHLERGAIEEAIKELEATLLLAPAFTEARALLAQAQSGSQTSAYQESPAKAPASGKLSGTRLNQALNAVRECPSVRNAILADPDGLLLAGSLGAADSDTEAAVAVQLGRDARRLIARLGAGELKSVLLRGAQVSLRCLSLPGATIIAQLDPTAPLGASQGEIEEAVSPFATSASPTEQNRECLAA
jgi:tetratricopeptide (TPR) repeat protein